MGQIEPRTIQLKDGSHAVIRTALPEDAEDVVAHLHRMFADAPWVLRVPSEATFPLEEQRLRLDEWLFAQRAVALIAERPVDGHSRIVAMAIFMTGGRQKIAHSVELGMGCDPEVRGLGIGRALLVAILDWAVTAPGLTKVGLRVYPANEHAVHLYTHVGFVEEARIPRASLEPDGSYHDMIQMAIYSKPGVAPAGFKTWPLTLA
jgi:RimJ/RimL family protein N-acetyltransferase